MKTTTSRYTETFLSRSAVLEASGSPASGQGACAEADWARSGERQRRAMEARCEDDANDRAKPWDLLLWAIGDLTGQPWILSWCVVVRHQRPCNAFGPSLWSHLGSYRATL